jgi:hypothetical protein
MRFRLIALACSTWLCLTTTANARPLQVLARGDTGEVTVSGLTGEIYLSLRGPEELLRRSNAAFIPGATLDNFVPGEVSYINLGGFGVFGGNVSMGQILATHQTAQDYMQVHFGYHYSINFFIKMEPHIVPLGFQPPADVEGFWITAVPEPATLGLIYLSLVGVVLSRRRKKDLTVRVIVKSIRGEANARDIDSPGLPSPFRSSHGSRRRAHSGAGLRRFRQGLCWRPYR